eukprot:CAMPEP_0182518430 /NCGR_PEP_ID=MMETSP1321-20130603/44263_1 /TAXON_ID=91990 /ORGANISM="Bolidomonas sp., Strain RCC1657" /LENGTH=134 /DNA_ID=CAMNT_0024726329 /DNA_START=191 /DNA_END=591 /DNA_ORIENTATION=-
MSSSTLSSHLSSSANSPKGKKASFSKVIIVESLRFSTPLLLRSLMDEDMVSMRQGFMSWSDLPKQPTIFPNVLFCLAGSCKMRSFSFSSLLTTSSCVLSFLVSAARFLTLERFVSVSISSFLASDLAVRHLDFS